MGQTYHLSSPATYPATVIWPTYAPSTSPNVQVGVREREVMIDRMSAMEGKAWAEFVRHADAAGDRLPPLGSPVQQVRATGLQGQLEWILGRERGAFRPQSPGPAGLWARVGQQQQKYKNAGAAVGLQGMRVGSASSHGRKDQRAHGTSRYMPNGACLEGTSIGHAMIWPCPKRGSTSCAFFQILHACTSTCACCLVAFHDDATHTRHCTGKPPGGSITW